MTEEKEEAAYWLSKAKSPNCYPDLRTSYALTSIAASLVWLAKEREAKDV